MLCSHLFLTRRTRSSTLTIIVNDKQKKLGQNIARHLFIFIIKKNLSMAKTFRFNILNY